MIDFERFVDKRQEAHFKKHSMKYPKKHPLETY